MTRPGPSVSSSGVIYPGADSLSPTGFGTASGGVRASSVGSTEITDGGIEPVDLDLTALKTNLNATYVQHAGPASGDATGVADAASLNAKLTAARLAGGGIVRGMPGASYVVNAPLVIGSGTTLDMTGCTLTLAAGSNCNIVRNYSDATPVATAADAAITSGSNVVTTSLASQAAVGMTVYIAGAGANGYGELIGNVSAVGGGTITLVKLYGNGSIPANASATVSAAAIQLSNRDTNVTFLAGTVNRGSNGPSALISGVRGEAVAGHSVFLRGVDRYRVEIRRALSTAGITFVWPTNASDGEVRIHDASVVRTACQPVGPIYNLRMYVAGNSNDDLVDLSGNVYPYQTNSCGDIIGVTIEDIIQKGQTNASALKLNAGQGNFIDNVVVTGRIQIENPSGAYFPVYIGEDVAYPATTGGTYGLVDLGHVEQINSATTELTVVCLSSASVEHLLAKIRCVSQNPIRIQGSNTHQIGVLDVTLDCQGNFGNGILLQQNATVREIIARVNYNPNVSSARAVTVQGSSVVGSIIIDAAAVTPSATATQFVNISGGTVSQVLLRGITAIYPDATNAQYLVYITTATVGSVRVQGCYVSGGDSLIRCDTGAVVDSIAYTDVTCSGNQRLLNTAVATVVFIKGVRRINCTQSPFNLQSAGLAVTIYAESYLSNGTPLGTNDSIVQGSNAANVVLYGLGLPVNAALVSVATAGARAQNTNAALDCGVGPVVSDGSGWRALTTGAAKIGTATLVAGTVTVANTSITANSVIRLSNKTIGGTPGALYVSAKTAGTGFTITSTNAADTSVVQYDILSY